MRQRAKAAFRPRPLGDDERAREIAHLLALAKLRAVQKRDERADGPKDKPL